MRVLARTHRPHLFLITVVGCLPVVFVLAASASRDSLLGIAIALAPVLVVTGWLTRNLRWATTDPGNPRSVDATTHGDRPGTADASF
jgi:hypothetical protein